MNGSGNLFWGSLFLKGKYILIFELCHLELTSPEPPDKSFASWITNCFKFYLNSSSVILACSLCVSPIFLRSSAFPVSCLCPEKWERVFELRIWSLCHCEVLFAHLSKYCGLWESTDPVKVVIKANGSRNSRIRNRTGSAEEREQDRLRTYDHPELDKSSILCNFSNFLDQILLLNLYGKLRDQLASFWIPLLRNSRNIKFFGE